MPYHMVRYTLDRVEVGISGHCRSVWHIPWDPTVPYHMVHIGWGGGRNIWSL